MRIMPSGKGDRNWLPSNLVKTASSDNEEAKNKEVYQDDLFEAAKKVVAERGCPNCNGTKIAGGVECEQCGGGTPVVGGDDFETSEEFETDNVEFEAEDGDVEVEVEEVSGEEGAVECLEKAKDAIEEAVECLGGGEEVEEFETEVEVEDDFGEEEVDVEVEDLDVEGGAGCVKAENCSCNCDPCECKTEGEPVEASANDWVKISAISPNNRKKIYDYWANKLKYPKDFVKLMVKDYEK